MEVPRSNRYVLAVALGLVALVAVAYGGAYWFIHRSALSTQSSPGPSANSLGTAVVQSVPANVPVVPIPTLEPAPFPTPIYAASTSSSSSSAQAVPWTVTKVTDPQSHEVYWMAPPDIVAQVRHSYSVMDTFYRAHVFDLTPDDESRFFVEPLLDSVMRADQEDQQRGEARGRADLLRPDLRVLGFSADGRAVQIAQEFHGEVVPVYDRQSHKLIREEKSPVGVAISTLVYVATDGTWKTSATSFVPAPPGVN